MEEMPQLDVERWIQKTERLWIEVVMVGLDAIFFFYIFYLAALVLVVALGLFSWGIWNP